MILAAALLSAASAAAQPALQENPKMEGVFSCTVPPAGNPGPMDFTRCDFLIYPDGKISLEQAQDLLSEIGFGEEPLAGYTRGITVINPVGEKYDAEKDFERYVAVFNSRFMHTNLKIIALGSGATFVNSVVAPGAEAVAGIVSIDGKAPSRMPSGSMVPAYVAGKNQAKVLKEYVALNKAGKVGNQGGAVLYRNPDEPLAAVAAGDPAKKDLKSMMAEAWDLILGRNYRLSNWGHTSYMGDSYGRYPFELEEVLVPEFFGMTKKVVEDSLVMRKGSYLWFEYYNDAVADAPEKSIPLVVLLHGNGNDPRTQAATSGFVQLASRENFMVIELEWQGTNGKNEWMGLDGIELTINTVLARYPQLDPSRIYAEGLSAGGFCCHALGVHKSYIFAAVGSHSGGVLGEKANEGMLYSAGINQASLFGDAAQKRGHVTMPIIAVSGTVDIAVPHPSHMDISDQYEGYPLPVDPEELVIKAPEQSEAWLGWQLYRLLNGADRLESFDTSVDPIFGQKLDSRTCETVKGYNVHSGDVLVGGIPVLRLVGVENHGHWNFVPAAAMMWEYWKHFRRDPSTRELIYTE